MIYLCVFGIYVQICAFTSNDLCNNRKSLHDRCHMLADEHVVTLVTWISCYFS